MLTEQPDMERAYFCRNGVSAEALRTLAGLLLFQKPTKLTTLHFFNNMADDGGAEAAADIVRESPQLQDFRFASCRSKEAGGMAIAKALDVTTALRSLDLNDNSFDEEVAATLAAVIAKQRNLVRLDLGDTGLNDDGVKAVAEAVAQNCKNLEVCRGAARYRHQTQPASAHTSHRRFSS